MNSNAQANPVTTTFCPKCGKVTSQTWNGTIASSTMPSVQSVQGIVTVSARLDTTTSVIMPVMQWCQCANLVK